MADLLIYGATGYTGRQASSLAKALGLSFILGGRSETKLAALSIDRGGTAYRPFSIDHGPNTILTTALKDVKILLNCAGPFIRTAEPLIRACIEAGVHYLDFSAELCSYELAEVWDQRARDKGVMLLPGCGGSVAMLGCLALYALEKSDIRNAVSIDIALHISGSMSRGSAISAAEQGMTADCLQLRDGRLEPHDTDDTKEFDFDNGRGPVSCFPVTLPDLITIRKATGVPNITTYAHADGDAFPEGEPAALAGAGPTAEERKANPYHASVVVNSEAGDTRHMVLHTVNGYTFTGMASIEAAKRVMNGEVQAGFQTPAGLFGSNFVTDIAGSRFIEL